MSQAFRSTLLGDLEVDLELDAQIGASTHYSIGGRADVLVRPRSADSLSVLLRRCHDDKIPCRILGKGANLLIDDVGVDGIVVKLDHRCFTSTRFNCENDIHSLHAMGGADLAKIIMETVRLGLDGLTSMTGIPATVGGAIRMNAGGLYGCISDSLSTVTCLSKVGELVTHNKSEVYFGYRECRIAEPLILSATFDLIKSDAKELRERVKEIFSWKISRQPLAESSAGCVFKNPQSEHGERISAGKIIDSAGLKGLSIGGASISKHHANFITTKPEATANDVITLISEIKKQVLARKNIILQEEVVIWSRDLEVQR